VDDASSEGVVGVPTPQTKEYRKICDDGQINAIGLKKKSEYKSKSTKKAKV